MRKTKEQKIEVVLEKFFSEMIDVEYDVKKSMSRQSDKIEKLRTEIKKRYAKKLFA